MASVYTPSIIQTAPANSTLDHSRVVRNALVGLWILDGQCLVRTAFTLFPNLPQSNCVCLRVVRDALVGLGILDGQRLPRLALSQVTQHRLIGGLQCQLQVRVERVQLQACEEGKWQANG